MTNWSSQPPLKHLISMFCGSKDRRLDIAKLYQKWCGAQICQGVKPKDYACVPVDIDEEMAGTAMGLEIS